MERCVNDYFIFNEQLRSTKEFVVPEEGVKVYEVIRVIEGLPLFMEEHMERLTKSLKLAGHNSKYSAESIATFTRRVIKENNGIQGNIKIVLNFHNSEQQIYVFYIPHSYPDEVLYRQGVDTILFNAERSNPNAKIINNSLRDRVNQKLKEASCYEAILVDSKGRITEGSRSNLFFVKDDILITSPVEAVLSGITRERIIKLCRNNDIEVKEEYVREEEVENCNAAFISGTSPKILPIKTINSIKFNSSSNLMVKKLMTLYDNNIKDYIKEHR